MSHVPLHLKYRPKTFDELVGRDYIARVLRNAIRLDKLNNSFLFIGQHGSGKTSIARILAKAINCNNVDDGNPCNSCRDCKLADNGTHPDLYEIDGASNSGVDKMREIVDISKYGGSRSKYRIFIIDEVHSISKQAFNALLKTLEEPQSHVKFILCSTERSKIPDTIRARSMEFVFDKIPGDIVFDRLKYVAECEKIDVKDEQLRIMSKRAKGSVRDGLVLLDLFALSGEIEFGNIDSTLFINIFKQIIKGDLERVIVIYKELGVPPLFLLEEMLEYIMGEIISNGKLLSIMSHNLLIKIVNTIEKKLNSRTNISDDMLYEMTVISIFDIVQSLGIVSDVVEISKRLGGTFSQIENGYEIISKRGNKLTILERDAEPVGGFYAYYPFDTAKILKGNKSIRELIDIGIIKKG